MTESAPSKKIQVLRDFTVQIRHIQTQAIVGTGFVVSQDGLIATCAHVVVAAGVNPRFGRIPSHWELIRNSFFSSNDSLQTDRTAAIPIYFPQAKQKDQQKQKAIVVGCFQDYDDDVVLLQLQADELPEGVEVALVDGIDGSVNVADSRRFKSFGYQRLSSYDVLYAEGVILGIVPPPSDRTLLKDPVQLQSSTIDSGISGAAVLDVVRDRVVGIIAETSTRVEGRHQDTGFAVDYAVVQMLPDWSEALLKVSSTQSDRSTPTPQSNSVPAASSGVKPVALPATLSPDRFDLKRAPKPLDEWVGREELLRNLDQDWESADLCITGLIGFGGEGKSSLARRWVDRLRQLGSPQPDGVFWWGFYENLDVEQFFEALLCYLEPTIDPKQYPSSSARVAYLQATLHRSRHRYLLVLDGLEVLQHSQGDKYGLFTSVDLKNWLDDFAEARHSSFCLITSRAPLLDLNYSTYTHRQVDHFSENEGVELLQNLGVKGRASEVRQVVQQWGGYALVLSLLGSYLVDHCNGDIRQLPADLTPTAAEAKYDRVRRVLRRYDEALTAADREFLEGFSAFRLPVPKKALKLLLPASLKQSTTDTRPQQVPPPPEPEGFWATVRRTLLPPFLRESESKQPAATSQPAASNSAADEATALEIVDRLVKYRILRYNPDTITYTTHPLIRDHYLQRLKQHLDRAVALHRQIADFYLTTAGDTPKLPTLADLTPLIEAVHHRCQAGDYDQAFNEIAWKRIYQRDRRVLTTKLGAYDTALTLLQDFFPGGDTTQNPQVSRPGDQRWIVNSIGFCLMSLGRLAEAPRFYEKGAEAHIKAKDWHNTSNIYQNLASLYAYLGDLSASATAAESALTYARRVADEKKRKRNERNSLVFQGWAAHLQGNLDAAQTAFEQAEQLEQQIDPDRQYLYSDGGIRHAEHLRRRGDADADCRDYARRITEENLEICKRVNNHWLDKISLCYRLLGDLTDKPQADLADKLQAAQEHYNEALRLARSISEKNVLLQALLARGRWAARQGDTTAASSDLEEALGYAIEGGYRIHEADIRIALAWMHQASGNRDAAQREARRSQRMSQSMGYYWGQLDAAEVLAALGIDQPVA